MLGGLWFWICLGFGIIALVKKMDSLQKPIDLKLWLNADLIQQQNLLKRQFTAIFEDVGSVFSQKDLQQISQKSRGVKLSKGNDLLGFPYQVLDLIRDFDPLGGVNIRILNWFGNGIYLTVYLGKNRKKPIQELISSGFYFGLSENQWDYPDLILNKNLTDSALEIKNTKLSFHHWIKKVEPTPEPTTLREGLTKELKKIIDILRLS